MTRERELAEKKEEEELDY
jgi:hypothetical protein